MAQIAASAELEKLRVQFDAHFLECSKLRSALQDMSLEFDRRADELTKRHSELRALVLSVLKATDTPPLESQFKESFVVSERSGQTNDVTVHGWQALADYLELSPHTVRVRCSQGKAKLGVPGFHIQRGDRALTVRRVR